MKLKEIQEKCQRENKGLKIVNGNPVFIRLKPKKAMTHQLLRELNIDTWNKGKWNNNSVYDTHLGIDIIPA